MIFLHHYLIISVFCLSFSSFITNFQSIYFFFFFSSRRRHTRCLSDWSSDVCSSDLPERARGATGRRGRAPPSHLAQASPPALPRAGRPRAPPTDGTRGRGRARSRE